MRIINGVAQNRPTEIMVEIIITLTLNFQEIVLIRMHRFSLLIKVL